MPGLTLLRTAGQRAAADGPVPADGQAAAGGPAPEIWCRCDGGPHGYLSIAAHAHADALSVEVRYGGVDILADPGTYCYHGEPEWRSYFRSTIAHNTVELDGQNQSGDGGPFLWLRHANGRETGVRDAGDGRRVDRGARRLPVAATRRPGTAARSGWTGRHAASHIIGLRSTAAVTTSAWPSTWAPTCRRNSTVPARCCAGRVRHRRERPGWNCPASCGGACTGARRTRSSAGTHAASGAGFPLSRCSAAGARRPTSRSCTRLEFARYRHRDRTIPIPGQPYHCCTSDALARGAPGIQAEAG